MATTEAFHAQPASAQDAVRLDGLQKVTGTGGLKTATGIRLAREKREHRREEKLIGANGQPD
jgi:hypothetical protein